MGIDVWRPTAEDWDLVRAVRLRALADAPDAFGSTLAAEIGLPEAAWRERAPSFVLAGGRDGSAPVAGLAAGWQDPAVPRCLQLVAMWVDPGHRRAGVGRALVDAVVEGARHLGVEEVRLWVTSQSSAARLLYEGCGFSATGEVVPLPSNPALDEERMVLVLG